MDNKVRCRCIILVAGISDYPVFVAMSQTLFLCCPAAPSYVAVDIDAFATADVDPFATVVVDGYNTPNLTAPIIAVCADKLVVNFYTCSIRAWFCLGRTSN